MRNLVNIMILLSCLTANGQTITERFILADNKDSLYFNSSKISFDKKGNYCFVIEKDDQEYFVTNKDTIGGFKFIGSTYGNGGEINYTNSYSDPKEKPYYYKNAKGTKIYGTAIGKIESYQTSNTRENIAITTTLNDSIYKYINGSLVAQNHKEQVESFYISERDWVSFSENGNVIYFLKQDSLYKLFVNEILIDTSKFRYNQLAINDNGTYIFAKGKRPEKPIGKYNYMFFIHSMDTVLGYVRTVWDYELKENGAYYYSGNDNGPYYIAINDKLHKDIKPVSNITLIDKKTYLYSFGEKDKNKINVNGEIYSHNFEEIFYPSIDRKGNFAFYGMKDYYLYKFVNGKKIKQPLSKYGVRATPLYISPNGESIHYFKTVDSIYLYQDDKLVFSPIPKNSNFIIQPHKEILPYNFIRGKTENGNSLFYLEYEKQGYFVFNGKFSKPLLPIKEQNFSIDKEQGSIVAGTFSDNGFFAIQKVGNGKFLIVVNNQVYKELDGVDHIVSDSYFFDGNSLTFYGVKKSSFYQFTMSL
ncbi:MAG: hypothetical protein ACOCQ4_02230 [bacterium]